MENSFTLSTNKAIELVDISNQVKEIVNKAKVESGLCLVFIPHSTAALVKTEKEHGLEDWNIFLSALPPREEYKHNQIDNNAESHLLAGLIGPSKLIPVENNQLQTGTWQQIF